MTGERFDGRFLGASPGSRIRAHTMVTTGSDALQRYRSVCGVFWTDTLYPASDDVPDCRLCARRPEGRQS